MPQKGATQKMSQIMEKIRRLAIYGYTTAKYMDQEAKELATKALRLPTSVRYLEDNDDGDKKMAFSPETVEKIFQARYESSVLRSAVARNDRGNGNYGNRYG